MDTRTQTPQANAHAHRKPTDRSSQIRSLEYRHGVTVNIKKHRKHTNRTHYFPTINHIPHMFIYLHKSVIIHNILRSCRYHTA